MKKTGLNGYIYNFSVDYDAIAVDNILEIHNYLIKIMIYYKMFGLIKKAFFFAGFTILSSIKLLSAAPLKYISMANRECKVRPQIVNVNSNDPVFYPFSIKASKCSGSCNNINDSYAKICIPDVVKNLNVKVFNLMSRTNEARHIEWHETFKCKC